MREIDRKSEYEESILLLISICMPHPQYPPPFYLYINTAGCTFIGCLVPKGRGNVYCIFYVLILYMLEIVRRYGGHKICRIYRLRQSAKKFFH